MNSIHYNILQSRESLTLDFVVLPISQTGFRFTQGGSVLLSSITQQSVRFRYSDGVSVVTAALSTNSNTARAIPTGDLQTISVDIAYPDNVYSVSIVNGKVQQELTENLRFLKNCSSLQIQDNNITGFPAVILQMPALQTLIMSNESGITSIPSTISASAITLLEISNLLNLASLPASIVNSQIQTFNLFVPKSNFAFPSNMNTWSALRNLRLGRLSGTYTNHGNSTGIVTSGGLVAAITNCTQITTLELVSVSALRNITNLGNMTGLVNLWIGTNVSVATGAGAMHLTTYVLPASFANLIKLKYIRMHGMNLAELARTNELIDSLYSITVTNAPITGIATNSWRSVTLDIRNGPNTGTVATPSGTLQAPSGYVQGSSNGTPASQKEKIYVLITQYAWSIFTQ